MEGVGELGEGGELGGVDGEVELAVHDVDVAPLGVEGDAGLPGPLEGRLHVRQAAGETQEIFLTNLTNIYPC